MSGATNVSEQWLALLPEVGATWCRIVGTFDRRPPILLLHGGPGFNSEYLRPFEVLAATGRRVIRYDQLGGGRSALPESADVDGGLFNIELFRRELTALRAHLGLDRVHIIGQSWGCMLALEHVLEGATGVESLVLVSGLASVEEWNAETLRLRSELPPDVVAVLDAEQHAGRTQSDAFRRAYAVWERTHMLRMDDPPEWELQASAMFEREHRVYDQITGGAEFPSGGGSAEFLAWDVRPRLGEVRVPTMLLSGRFDEATPAIVGSLHRGISNAEWYVLEESSHSCHSEQEAQTMVLVTDFLARVDGAATEQAR
jgi:L-proline amide hydrolase